MSGVDIPTWYVTPYGSQGQLATYVHAAKTPQAALQYGRRNCRGAVRVVVRRSWDGPVEAEWIEKRRAA